MWLRDVVTTLGHDGASSDESEGDDGIHDGHDGIHDVFRAKIMPWRRDIGKELDLIDSLRGDDNCGFSRQGSKPVMRYRESTNPVSMRQPAEKLPRVLYDNAWIRQQYHTGRCVEFSAEPFLWMELLLDHGEVDNSGGQMEENGEQGAEE
jgi:hypothetical protein